MVTPRMSSGSAAILEAALGIDVEPLMNMQIRYNILTAKRNATFQAKLNSVRRIADSITL